MPDARFRQFTTGIQIKTNLFFKTINSFQFSFCISQVCVVYFSWYETMSSRIHSFCIQCVNSSTSVIELWIISFHFDLDSNLYFSSSLLHFILSFRIFFFTPVEVFFYNCSDVCEALLLIIAPSRGEMLCHRRGYLIPSDCVLCQMLMTDLIKDVFLNCLFYQKTELLRNTSLILKFHIKVPAVKECRQQELSNQ